MDLATFIYFSNLAALIYFSNRGTESLAQWHYIGGYLDGFRVGTVKGVLEGYLIDVGRVLEAYQF